jgi:hypothetical protein
MPKGAHERQSDADLSVQLADELGTRYSALVVRAKGMTEPDLLRQCRDELETIRCTPVAI